MFAKKIFKNFDTGIVKMLVHVFYFIRNLAQGLVLKVTYFWVSFYQILVLKFVNSSLIFTAHIVP